jgi:hypothetical protein
MNQPDPQVESSMVRSLKQIAAWFDGVLSCTMLHLGTDHAEKGGPCTVDNWITFTTTHAAIPPWFVAGVEFAITAVQTDRPMTPEMQCWTRGILLHHGRRVREFPASPDFLPKLQRTLAERYPTAGELILPEVTRLRIVQRHKRVYLETTRRCGHCPEFDEMAEVVDLHFVAGAGSNTQMFTTADSACQNAHRFVSELSDIVSLANCTSLIGAAGERLYEEAMREHGEQSEEASGPARTRRADEEPEDE